MVTWQFSSLTTQVQLPKAVSILFEWWLENRQDTQSDVVWGGTWKSYIKNLQMLDYDLYFWNDMLRFVYLLALAAYIFTYNIISIHVSFRICFRRKKYKWYFYWIRFLKKYVFRIFVLDRKINIEFLVASEFFSFQLQEFEINFEQK